jgi:predicted tellurium resistance membrane protein TerC
MQRAALLVYYAATALFVALDFGFGVNVRVAFLETAPGLRIMYYAACFACLVLIVWRPALTALIGTIESLVTLVALILNTALRVMLVTDAMLETGTGFITVPEIVNFAIAGTAAYVAWWHGLRSLQRRT